MDSVKVLLFTLSTLLSPKTTLLHQVFLSTKCFRNSKGSKNSCSHFSPTEALPNPPLDSGDKNMASLVFGKLQFKKM